MNTLHTRTYMIGRSSGGKATKASAYRSGSIVAAAAYRANERLEQKQLGKTHDYSRKHGVAFTKIFLPEGATKEFNNRETLWNAVEQVEKRKDAQLARQWQVAFPNEFDRETQIDLVSKFINDYFVSRGMIADLAIHDKGDGNPHAHVLLTLRRADEQGFTGNKERVWNDRKLAQLWRNAFAERCNEIFVKMDLPTRIDPRSYEIQNNGLIPTIHLGKEAGQLEKKGIATELGNRNREIMARNQKYMNNVLYDAMTTQPEGKPPVTQVLNDVKQSKGENEMPPKVSREQLLEDQKTRPDQIKEEKRKLDSLQEWQEVFADFTERLEQAQESGNQNKIDNLNQSIREAEESFVTEWVFEKDRLPAVIKQQAEILEGMEGYYQNIPNLIREWDKIEGKKPEQDKVVKVQFGDHERDREVNELEQEEDRER